LTERNDYSSYAPSLRKRVYELWLENERISPSEVCKKLSLDPKLQGQTVRNYLYQFRRNYVFGLPQGPHRRVFVWERVEGDREAAVGAGWRHSRNRNGALVFEGREGVVHWFKGGKVMLYLKHGLSLARAKELFSRAFGSFVSDDYLVRLLDAPMRTTEKHHVFEVCKNGERLPKFKIEKFEKSHGLLIYTDGSHPSSIEVKETEPFWLERLNRVLEQLEGKPQPLNRDMERLYDR